MQLSIDFSITRVRAHYPAAVAPGLSRGDAFVSARLVLWLVVLGFLISAIVGGS